MTSVVRAENERESIFFMKEYYRNIIIFLPFSYFISHLLNVPSSWLDKIFIELCELLLKYFKYLQTNEQYYFSKQNSNYHA